MTETQTSYTITPRFTALSRAFEAVQLMERGAEMWQQALGWTFDNPEADMELYNLYNLVAPGHIRQARARTMALLHRGEA